MIIFDQIISTNEVDIVLIHIPTGGNFKKMIWKSICTSETKTVIKDFSLFTNYFTKPACSNGL